MKTFTSSRKWCRCSPALTYSSSSSTHMFIRPERCTLRIGVVAPLAPLAPITAHHELAVGGHAFKPGAGFECDA